MKFRDSADMFINRVMDIINEKINATPRYTPATVQNVDENGVSVTLPGSEKWVLLKNQTPFAVEPGDGVVIAQRNNTLNGAWICCVPKFNYGNTIEDLQITVTELQKRVEELEEKIGG